ncbi:hypothetical protein HO133_005984 [Letharia lupina]|uniref:Uncharacterized protein n=1 Tax=Letharia lupina TaxID=560253 RepID=A0A8H6C8D0_9LECA|nr:uncharacterized protein HO133_005984 [Letharia lupina]KAF6218633.1 hypothetical protein HO133_005984 [Letharia lupina]
MASTMVMSGMEVTESVSNIKLSEAQREAEQTPSEPIQPAQPRGNYDVDESMRACELDCQNYAMSTWGKTAKVIVEVSSGEERTYFLKVVTMGAPGKHMCEGEFESLKTIHTPASPMKLAAGLANLHKESVSPTGKFGFHIATCHARVAQAVDTWEDSCKQTYIRQYKSRLPVSPPNDDWDARNILSSLTFNIANTIYIPGSYQRQVVYDDMTTLCKMFRAHYLKRDLKSVGSIDSENEQATAGMDADEEDGEEELEEEEEEEEEVEE